MADDSPESIRKVGKKLKEYNIKGLLLDSELFVMVAR